jgi:hypothetical protein
VPIFRRLERLFPRLEGGQSGPKVASLMGNKIISARGILYQIQTTIACADIILFIYILDKNKRVKAPSRLRKKVWSARNIGKYRPHLVPIFPCGFAE